MPKNDGDALVRGEIPASPAVAARGGVEELPVAFAAAVAVGTTGELKSRFRNFIGWCALDAAATDADEKPLIVPATRNPPSNEDDMY